MSPEVPELKEAGVKIKVGDVAYGGGTQDPTKILRQETEALREPLSKFKTKDWASLQTWLKENLKRSVRGLSKKEQLAYCSILSRGGLPGNCAAAIDANPVKTAEIFSKAEATSGAMAKVEKCSQRIFKSFG